jgi:flagellin-like hook-associated protein FlgL
VARITNAIIANNVRQNLQGAAKRLEETQRRLSAGLSISKPSDDPVRANRILALRSSIAQNEQFVLNANHGEALINVANGAYEDISNVLFRARDLAHQALSGSNAPSDYKFLAEEVSQLVEGVLDSANTDFTGISLFAGNRTDQPPFVVKRETTTSLVRDFRLTGNVGINAVRVSPSNAEAFAVGDEITISDLDNSEIVEIVDIQLVGDESTLILAAPLQSNYLVRNEAKVKGVGETAVEIPVLRDILRNRITLSLGDARGVMEPNDIIRIADNDGFEEAIVENVETNAYLNEITVSLTRPLLNNYSTVGDAKAAKAFDVEQGEITSVQYAGDRGIHQERVGRTTFIPMTTPGDIAFERVFDQLLRLRDALRSSGLEEVEKLIENLGDSTDHIAQLQTESGAKIQRINTLRIRLEDSSLALQNFLQQIEQLNLTDAVIDFQTQETILNATLSTGARVLTTSLFNFI